MCPIHKVLSNSVLVITICLAAAGSVKADALFLTLTDPVQAGRPGDLITLSGTVTNTGERLIELNGNTIRFLGNPNIFTNISIEPVGRSPLPAMTSVGPAPLVSFTIAADAPIGTFTYDIAVHDLSPLPEREFSNFAPFTISVRPIPEPATMFLFGTGIVGTVGIMRKRQQARMGENRFSAEKN